MGKQLIDLENQMINERPVYRYTEPVVMYKPDQRCGCGCGEVATIGYEYDGEMFATQGCVIRMMISEGWLKEVG